MTEKTMEFRKQGRRTKRNGDKILAFDAHILDDGTLDPTPSGGEVYFFGGSDDDGDRAAGNFRARLSFEAEFRPVQMVRSRGKWYLTFCLAGEDSPLWAVGCGAGEPWTMEEAASRLCGAVDGKGVG